MDLVPEHTGLTSDVLRMEWSVDLGDRLTLTVHDRFLWSASTASASLFEGGLGIGRALRQGGG